MKDAKDLIPWTVTDISIRPYDGYWSMNPSIHFDGQTWRCVLRCCDYAMPNGVTIRGKKTGPGHQTKNAMVVLDPRGWKAAETHKMHERDGHPRVSTPNVGYEDMRIFRTDRGGLQGIAASLHLARDARPGGGGGQHQPPEQVLLTFDEKYDIIGARPIRGDWWSGTPQKNWVPFDDCVEPRFLYSIQKGSLFDDRGALRGDGAIVRASPRERSIGLVEIERVLDPGRVEHAEVDRPIEPSIEDPGHREPDREESLSKKDRPKVRDLRVTSRATDSSLRRGMRRSHDTVTARPSYTVHHPSSRHAGRLNTEVVGARTGGRTLLPRYEGLRGGTQLVRVGSDAWLGIGHEMQFLKGKKYYWHTWYLVDARGKMSGASDPMKLVPNGIEFAAGMAIDGDRVVVSFGVDDMECKIGETRLSAVMGKIRPVPR